MTSPVVTARGLTRVYGEGETAVHALRGVDLDIDARPADRRHGPVRVRQVHPHAPPRRARQARRRDLLDRGRRGHRPRRRGPDRAAPRAHRLHLPVLQPAADAHGARRTSCCPPRSPATTSTRRGWRSWSERVGLADRLGHRPSELSGGQQQRVAVARSLASRPTVLFADEPTGNLDSTTSQEILDLLRTAVDGFGQTTVMVTHDPHAAAIADRVLRPRRRPDRPRDETERHETRRSEGPVAAPRPRPADDARRRPRRRDGVRHLRPHGHDRQGVRRDLHDRQPGRQRGRHRQGDRRGGSSGTAHRARVPARRVRDVDDVGEADGHRRGERLRHRPGPPDRPTARRSATRTRPSSASAATSARTASTRSSSCDGPLPRRRRRGRHRQGHSPTTRTSRSATRSASPAQGGERAVQDRRHRQVRRGQLARRRDLRRSSTSPTGQQLLDKEGRLDRSPSRRPRRPGRAAQGVAARGAGLRRAACGPATSRRPPTPRTSRSSRPSSGTSCSPSASSPSASARSSSTTR